MAPKGRPRACEPCHSLKIKCELSLSEAAPPCQRCQRLDKECVIAPPRRQRDRITELENKIEELTRLLQSQGIESSETTSPDSLPSQQTDQSTGRTEIHSIDAKKRKISNEGVQRLDPTTTSMNSFMTTRTPYEPGTIPDGRSMDDDEGFELCAKLDSSISTSTQQRILDYYTGSVVPVYPLVPVSSSKSLTQMRLETPMLLLVILAFPTAGVLPQDTQAALVRDATIECATSMIARGNRSLEIVNALTAAALWYRSTQPKSGVKSGGKIIRHGSIYQLVQLATSAAIEMGIAGPQSWTSVAFERTEEDTSSLDARRAWLACFVATSAVAVVMRRWDANANWSTYHDECLSYLSASSEALKSDRLFCQIIRGECLCNRVATHLALCDSAQLLHLSDPVTLYVSRMLRGQIDEWTAQIPLDLQLPQVMFWRHIALIYTNEIVLHTSTNKTSFGAPFLEDRVKPTDFAAPVLSPDHIAALHTLKESCHSALDAFMEMSPETILALPTLIYSPRMLYALLVLLKLYVAVAAPGNTYGTVMARTELYLEKYFSKIKSMGAALRSLDANASTTRLVSAHSRLEDWYLGYRATVDRYETNLAQGLTSVLADGLDFQLQDTDLSAGTEQQPNLWDDFWMGGSDNSWFGNLFNETTPDINAGIFG